MPSSKARQAKLDAAKGQPRKPTTALLVSKQKRTGKLDASLTEHPSFTENKVRVLPSYQEMLVAARNSSPDKPLTEKQREFVKHWARGESATSAIYKAGYRSPTSGYLIMQMPAAIALYEKEKAAYERVSDMTKKRVMDMLVESYEMAKLMAEPSTMVGAAREIGKMCGYYAPVKAEITVNDGSSQKARMERMSDEELERIVGGKLPDGAMDAIKEAEHARSTPLSYNGPTGASLADEFDDFDAAGEHDE